MKKNTNIIIAMIIGLSLIIHGRGKKLERRETVTFTDFVGREVKIPKTVQRIVSMCRTSLKCFLLSD